RVAVKHAPGLVTGHRHYHVLGTWALRASRANVLLRQQWNVWPILQPYSMPAALQAVLKTLSKSPIGHTCPARRPLPSPRWNTNGLSSVAPDFSVITQVAQRRLMISPSSPSSAIVLAVFVFVGTASRAGRGLTRSQGCQRRASVSFTCLVCSALVR